VPLQLERGQQIVESRKLARRASPLVLIFINFNIDGNELVVCVIDLKIRSIGLSVTLAVAILGSFIVDL